MVAASCFALTLPAKAQALSPAEAQQIATDAYVYGYSLITTEVTRVQMSNVPKVEGFNSPTGQFVNVPRYPPADYRGVSAPNADTLYSVAWLDLSEPQVFSHPDMGSRFYLFEITDLWMSDSESSPSKRTADGKAANYLFTGPDIPQTALKTIEANKNSMGEIVNGWVVSKGLGTYGPGDYLKRATVAAFGWPANNEHDAIYPYTEVDSAGQKLTGANKYTLTFAKDATPPVNGFWSITMYMIDGGWWFVPNALNKFTVSPRDNPKPNADGTLTLYFQNESPGKDKEANWLPAPKGDFLPMMRMYWPKGTSPSIINGSWKPPAVVKVN